ncbi:hypothetical protein H4696_003354 [Amycolatopsis lexingtonensis]|uniref:YobI-like P-loop NTPase domain-containing protein n=2 Tax=Amycolatopsis lexingtonensis TaxID=218822 RepID=A0ABR9HZB7_9PSEU|nr:hypothetical protein [Amycolatopsis lexingtonensis]
MRWTRLNEHYRPAVELARLILTETEADLGAGQVAAPGLVVTMHNVFEKFVRTATRRTLGLTEHEFPAGKHAPALHLDDQRKLNVQPDLSLWVNGRCRFVDELKYRMDTSAETPSTSTKPSPTQPPPDCPTQHSSTPTARRPTASTPSPSPAPEFTYDTSTSPRAPTRSSDRSGDLPSTSNMTSRIPPSRVAPGPNPALPTITIPRKGGVAGEAARVPIVTAWIVIGALDSSPGRVDRLTIPRSRTLGERGTAQPNSRGTWMTNADVDQPSPEGARTEPAPAPFKLLSLSSEYMTDQHGTYLRHLQEAVAAPKNFNIALAGRYGTGKSSVLDRFAALNKKTTMRIAISTLGPDIDDKSKDITNRIQKELVKQLLYQAVPRQSRFSRFNRIVALSRTRAAVETAAAVAVAGAILASLGWLPNVIWTGPGNPGAVRALAWAGFAMLVIVVLTTLRLVIYGRFLISDVSAAGATVKLTKDSSTYFDEYLEEIVYFFDQRKTEVVIFEDLDRFDDPHIFEAVRELNTLLNQTPKRVKKKPLRFVYAVKDSLFERLGSEAGAPPEDATADETVRANRTKFFDVVIPVVPFISHHNARELLARLIADGGFTGIDRQLVTLVAQYATDMRLLKNICNEFAVFAERLLLNGKTAPGLRPSVLFALVVYKNFHLKDFEDIAGRRSDLDALQSRRRELVRATIEDCERRRREIVDGVRRFDTRQALARKLGDRLVAAAQLFKDTSGHSGYRHVLFNAGARWNSEEETRKSEFWAAVCESDQLALAASNDPKNVQTGLPWRLTRAHIDALFPEAADADRWAEFDRKRQQEEITKIDSDIAFLRGADFKDLAGRTRFMTPAADEEAFGDFIERKLRSELAVQLVKQGYLDRNFALYAAQFYGDFTGVDVANFIVQTVQTNAMDVDHPFSGPAAIANLLEEAPDYFPDTISAYHPAVLDYLLERDDARARRIVGTIVADFGDEARKFVSVYFNSGTWRVKFVMWLTARPWRDVFTYLTQAADIPSDVTPELVGAALQAATEPRNYQLGPEIRDFIVEHFRTMPVFTSRMLVKSASKIVGLLKHIGVILPELDGVDAVMRGCLVEEHLYRLTADNLRKALGGAGDISLDRVRQNADVHEFCLNSPAEYLAAVASDTDRTPHTVVSETTLVETLTKIAESWTETHARELIAKAAPSCRVAQLDSAPVVWWPLLADNHLFRATAGNVLAYLDTVGSFGQSLADLIVEAGSIDAPHADADVGTRVAVVVLNAAAVIPDARRRVSLVCGLPLDLPLPVAELTPEAGDLLALLLKHGLVADSLETFWHFRGCGWSAFERAIPQSKGFVDFMTPDLIDGFTGAVLGARHLPEQIRDKIINNLREYASDGDATTFDAAARYVIDQGRGLPPIETSRVAAATRDANLTMQLLSVGTLSPEEIVSSLNSLGAPYDNLGARSEGKFDVPFEAEHRKAFEKTLARLKRARVIADYKKPRMRDVFTVSLGS